jgi:hypothetical protein
MPPVLDITFNELTPGENKKKLAEDFRPGMD